MHLELDLVSKAGGQAVQTVIREFSPWQQVRCETVRCLGETGFSFLQMWPFLRKFCLQLVK